MVDSCPASTENTFDIHHGGLFFLLNAALQLKLYGDFSQPMERELPCSPWRFLWLAGSAMCGANFRTDPLAEWLARRDNAASGRCASAPDDWRIPPQWLQPFPPTRAAWPARWRNGRLCLKHPAGFVVMEVNAAPSQCEALLAAELARLAIAPAPVVNFSADSGPERRRRAPRHACPPALWPYLRARLSLALAPKSHAGRRIAGRMLRLPARLQDSGTRVVLYLSLENLPLAVRMAGLDRDPGWIPAAGCDFRFHFH